MPKLGEPRKVMKLHSAAEFATEHIRHLIYTGTLVPGEKVGIELIAAELGTSATPVRDAFQRLRSEGLVDVVPRVGVYVREISVREVCEVYAIKKALEPLMASWATQLGSASERELFATSSQELVRIAESADVDAYVQLIEARRNELLKMSQSTALEEVFRTIDGRVRLLRYRNLASPSRMVESAAQHREIASAVLAGDPQLAARLTAEHVELATSRLKDLFAADKDSYWSRGRSAAVD